MYCAPWDIHRLPRLERDFFLSHCNQGLTTHHGPVLGAALVLLQAQSLARIDDKLLDLVVVPFEQVFVMPPRSVVLPILDDFVIHLHVLKRHALTCEVLLYLVTTGAPVECANPVHCLYGCIHIVNNISSTAVTNEFRH